MVISVSAVVPVSGVDTTVVSLVTGSVDVVVPSSCVIIIGAGVTGASVFTGSTVNSAAISSGVFSTGLTSVTPDSIAATLSAFISAFVMG